MNGAVDRQAMTPGTRQAGGGGGTRPHGRKRATVIGICFLIAAIEGFDIQAFGVVAPRLIAELKLDAAGQGWAASLAMTGLVIGAFAGGWLADRMGRRPVLFASVLIFGTASIATGMAYDYDTLLLARLVSGLGFGSALPNLIAIAAEISPPHRRGLTTSAMFCGMPAGGAIVALFASLAGDDLSWRTYFMAGGVLPLLIAPLILFVLPETRPARDDTRPISLSRTLFADGRALPTLLLWLANFLTLLILYLMLNWLPTLVVAKGFPVTGGATASLAFNLVGVVGALFLGLVIDRFGYRWSLFVTYALLAGVLLALGTASSIVSIVTVSALAGFLVLGAQYALYGLAPTLYPQRGRGGAAGAAVAVGRLGSIVGPLMAGGLRQAGWSPAAVLNALLPISLTAGVVVVMLTYRTRLTPEDEG